MKSVPCGLIEERDLLIALRKRIALCTITGGRSITQSSKDVWGCQGEEPSYLATESVDTGSGGLEIKIQKEIAENERGTMWSDRSLRLVDCVAQERNGNQEKKKNASMMIDPVLKADNIHVLP